MFAAYKDQTDQQKLPESTEFLANPSFEDNSKALVKVSSSDSSDFSSDQSDDEKPKAIEYYKTKPQIAAKPELYYIDKTPRSEYLKMDSLPIRGRYRVYSMKLLSASFYSRKKFRRYFKDKKSKKRKKEEPENDKSEEMRIYLSKNQNDVDSWIEYINYKVRLKFNPI